MTRTVRRRASRRDGADDRSPRSHVEVGRHLVEDHERGVAQERTRDRDPLLLAAGEPRAILAERRRVALGQGTGRTRRRRPRCAAASTSASVALGRASRMLSATVPANRCGACGTHATERRQCSDVDGGERNAVHRDGARVRLEEAEQEARDRGLPGARLSDERDGAAGRARPGPAREERGAARPRTRRARPRDGSRAATRARARVRGGDRRRRRRPGRGDGRGSRRATGLSPAARASRIASIRVAAASPAAPAWNRIASCRSGRKNSGVRMRTASARFERHLPRHEAEAHLDRDERRRHGAAPLEDEGGLEGGPQHLHRRIAVRPADRGDVLDLLLAAAEHLQRRRSPGACRRRRRSSIAARGTAAP